MSLAGFLGGAVQGYEGMREISSADAYRQSIIDMRNNMTRQQQSADADTQAKAYASFNTAAMKGQLPVGTTVLPGDLAWARQNLPAPAYQQLAAKVATEGWTPAQMQAMNTAPQTANQRGAGTMVGNYIDRMLGRQPGGSGQPGGSDGSGDNPDMTAALQQDQYMADMQANPGQAGAAQPGAGPQNGQVAAAIPMMPLAYGPDGQPLGQSTAQPPGQARGGVVPVPNYRTKYASGGPIDPDVSAAVAQANGQPRAAAPVPAPASPAQGAIPAPATPPASYTAAGPATPIAAPPIPPPEPGGGYTATGAATPVPQPAPPQAGAGTPPPVPPGGIQHMHPPGLQPLANPSAPLNVPPQAVQATTPAEAAMKHGQIAFGLHPGQNPQAQPAQSAANYTELQHGAGAESNATVQAARYKVLGPQVQTAPLGIQNALLTNQLYNYDMEHHGPAEAAADSFALLQNYRINMIMYGGAAEASFSSGNLPAAAHYLEQAYAFFPDGNEVSVKPGPGSSLVATRTDPNGKVLDTSSFATPSDLSAFVAGTTSFEGYNASLDAAQTAALKAAQIGDIANEEQNRNAGTGLRAQEVSQEGANIGNEITNRNKTTADDTLRTQHEISAPAGGTPTAQTYASYQNSIDGSNGVLSGQFGQTVGYNDAPAAMQTKLVQLATSLGVTNAMDPTTAVNVAGYILNNPSAVKNGAVTLGGQTFQVGKWGAQALVAPQAKATGGAVTPAARAMAALP